ncbi:Mnd1 family protein (macronuclear) [Tetrahymena thermophila SB210]|uniref:Mnd1 family protein n=1 Tax=Tetrahymena thermophila (strain SB210) TaxID=312017 RepID=W7X6A1_TETTS|nr:Mnd1 family protein [Tetrahymena thermophila SB210]EWS71873.1 Mnd1 family protein [Tetrahymena thermophila SB210]|eukprot:XP_012655617.1 Mnd1 family protein [Tetrahymena thermophila SB210]
MKRVKGLSAQEKQKAILEIFFETRDIFNKEEIEKEAKKKRINNPQDVQDILKVLVQDNLINKDKVGIGSFFWSFPNEKKEEMVKVINGLDEKMIQLNQKIQETEIKIQMEQSLRTSDDRDDLLSQHQNLKKTVEQKLKQVNLLKRNDPKRVQEMKNKIEQYRILANLWGDNIEALLSFLKKKFYMNAQDLKNYKEVFEIDQEIEYIESV